MEIEALRDEVQMTLVAPDGRQTPQAGKSSPDPIICPTMIDIGLTTSLDSYFTTKCIV